MTPEIEGYLAKAKSCLTDAQTVAGVNLPHIAAREAYLACYHAAEAFLLHRNGRTAKTHSGLRSEFARLVKDDPSFDRALVAFLARAYEMKSAADYSITSQGQITSDGANSAIEMAGRFVSAVEKSIAGLKGHE